MSGQLRIIFVCSGNICRSPMAAAIARDMLEDSDDLSAVIISAGTLGINGKEPAAFTKRALTEVGIDPPSTRSQGISPPLLERADYIPVMEPKHEEAILQAAPDAESAIVRMWEYADADLDGIDDPVGQNIEAFRQTRDLIYQCIDTWLDELTE